MKLTATILAAFCVAFILGSTGAANGKTHSDYVMRGLLCIHRYEGSWRANTGNGYYGGLQMDREFQQTFGWIRIHGSRMQFISQWGYAHNWPVWAQLQTGRNGYRARGWYPWPNTARICGLI